MPIVLGEHVTTDAGTGCVHTAPAHGLEDFDMGRRYDLGCTTLSGAMVFTTLTRQCLPDSIFSRRTMTSSPRYQSATCCCVTALPTQLSPLLAAQDADYFPCDAAVVHQYVG